MLVCARCPPTRKTMRRPPKPGRAESHRSRGHKDVEQLERPIVFSDLRLSDLRAVCSGSSYGWPDEPTGPATMPVGLLEQSTGAQAATQTIISAPGNAQAKVVVTSLQLMPGLGSGTSSPCTPPPSRADVLAESCDAQRRQLDHEQDGGQGDRRSGAIPEYGGRRAGSGDVYHDLRKCSGFVGRRAASAPCRAPQGAERGEHSHAGDEILCQSGCRRPSLVRRLPRRHALGARRRRSAQRRRVRAAPKLLWQFIDQSSRQVPSQEQPPACPSSLAGQPTLPAAQRAGPAADSSAHASESVHSRVCARSRPQTTSISSASSTSSSSSRRRRMRRRSESLAAS